MKTFTVTIETSESGEITSTRILSDWYGETIEVGQALKQFCKPPSLMDFAPEDYQLDWVTNKSDSSSSYQEALVRYAERLVLECHSRRIHGGMVAYSSEACNLYVISVDTDSAINPNL